MENKMSMKNTLIIIALFILVIAGGIAGIIFPRIDLSHLKRYSLEGTSMSIMLPSKPSKSVTALESVSGKLNSIEFNSGVGTLLFTVSYTDLPAEALPKQGDSIASYYEGALNRILSNTKAEVLDRKTIQYGDIPGIEVSLKTGAGFVITTRFLLSGSRFIQLTTTTTKENVKNPKIDEFMSSFSLGEK
jgi:hypothetical protein